MVLSFEQRCLCKISHSVAPCGTCWIRALAYGVITSGYVKGNVYKYASRMCPPCLVEGWFRVLRAFSIKHFFVVFSIRSTCSSANKTGLHSQVQSLEASVGPIQCEHIWLLKRVQETVNVFILQVILYQRHSGLPL